MSRIDLAHMQLKTNKFHGIYRGVVEDNVDPDMMGRCRIRVWGLHDDVKVSTPEEGIPTDQLPWAEPCLGLIEGSVSGLGCFSVPLQGSHVFMFFEGGNWGCPRFFATVPGRPVDAPDTSKGFNDPDGVYPKSDRLDEPDYPRLSRGDITDTIIETRNNNLDTGVSLAGGGSWDEPQSAYAAEYPQNIVISTHGGITIEIDNTLDAERLHVYHPSNTYIEIDVDGNVVFGNEGDRFEITRQTRNKHIMVDDNETIDGNKTSKVGSDRTSHIISNDDLTVGSNWSINVGGNISISAGGNITMDSGGSTEISAGSSLSASASSTFSASAGSTATVSASGPATLEGSVGVVKGTAKTFTVA